MKLQILLCLLFFFAIAGEAQDLIFKKDSTIQRAQILEVGTEKIKFKKFEIPKGPIFEISRDDVVKITYSNGYEDILDASYTNTQKFKLFKAPQNDTVGYSMIYILFHYGEDNSTKVPVYFNGKYIWTLKNHTRVAYKIYSEGQLIFERIDGNNVGPQINLFVQHGKNYGIYIEIPHPYAFSPGKKYSFRLVEEAADFHRFLYEDYFGFEPYDKEEKLIKEDRSNPVITKM